MVDTPIPRNTLIFLGDGSKELTNHPVREIERLLSS